MSSVYLQADLLASGKTSAANLTIGNGTDTILFPNTVLLDRIYGYTGTSMQFGASNYTVNIPGTISTATIVPNSGNTVSMGTSSHIISIPGTIYCNSMEPYSGTTMSFGFANTAVTLPGGSLNVNTITPNSGNTLNLGATGQTIALGGASGITPITLNANATFAAPANGVVITGLTTTSISSGTTSFTTTDRAGVTSFSGLSSIPAGGGSTLAITMNNTSVAAGKIVSCIIQGMTVTGGSNLILITTAVSASKVIWTFVNSGSTATGTTAISFIWQILN